ncbi:MAG: hypothetical protein Q9226_007960 [Calogaya cf. arnoldii]
MVALNLLNGPQAATQASTQEVDSNGSGPDENDQPLPPLRSRAASQLKAAGRERERDANGQFIRRREPKTRGDGDRLEVEITSGEWVPAVYHHLIRSQLFQETATQGTHLFQWEQNLANDHDMTSHNRDSHYQSQSWRDYQERFVNSGSVYRREIPQYVVNEMRFQGKIALAWDKHPILDFRHLPATISSVITGAEIAMLEQTDKRMEMGDIMARMPKDSNVNIRNLKGRRDSFLRRVNDKRERLGIADD